MFHSVSAAPSLQHTPSQSPNTVMTAGSMDRSRLSFLFFHRLISYKSQVTETMDPKERELPQERASHRGTCLLENAQSYDLSGRLAV